MAVEPVAVGATDSVVDGRSRVVPRKLLVVSVVVLPGWREVSVGTEEVVGLDATGGIEEEDVEVDVSVEVSVGDVVGIIVGSVIVGRPIVVVDESDEDDFVVVVVGGLTTDEMIELREEKISVVEVSVLVSVVFGLSVVVGGGSKIEERIDGMIPWLVVEESDSVFVAE